MTITLEAIKAEQSKLADMIAKFEAQAARTIFVPAGEVRLAEGERYAGIILADNGKPAHHVILLAGEAESLTWAAAKEWAVKIGGELPTRREQSLLFANCKGDFQSAWYWSSEIHASDSGYAWNQTFNDGTQDDYDVDGKCRARAVRRLVIE